MTKEEFNDLLQQINKLCEKYGCSCTTEIEKSQGNIYEVPGYVTKYWESRKNFCISITGTELEKGSYY